MCDYPHAVVTGASSRTGSAVTTLLAASGYHVYAGVSSFADGIALHAAVRRELAPWNTRVMLIGPADSPPEVARAVAQALAEQPHPRARLTTASCP